MKTEMRRRVLLAAVVVCVIVAVTLSLHKPPAAAVPERSAPTSPPQDAAGERTPATAPPVPHAAPSAAAPASVANAAPPMPTESDYFQARSERWTAAPPNRHDADSPIALHRDPSCLASAFLGESATLQAVLDKNLGVRDAAGRERLFFNKDRRFFARGGRFHQVTAVWDSMQPPRYRIEWFSAADPGLSTDVRSEPLPAGTPVYADAMEAREIIGAIAPAGDAADERLGSRFLSAEIPASPSTPAVEVGFVNGRPFAVGFDGGSCRLLASGDAAFCHCGQSSTGGDTHGH